MIALFFRFFWRVGVLPLALVAAGADAPARYWVFEGEVLSQDVRLATLADDDLVFAGSFAVSVYAPRSTDEIERGERFLQAAEAFEFTLDRFHVLAYQGYQRDDWQWFDIIPGADGEDDSLLMLFPAYGSVLGDSEWQVSWVQIGMQLEPGSISGSATWLNWTLPLRWKNGWFRLFLEPEAGNEQALIEGVLSDFQPAGDPVDPEQRIVEMEAILTEMARRLTSLEQENQRMASSLAAEQQRVAGMTRTLDRMMEEREHWNAERDRILAVSKSEDHDWKQRQAEWEVALALKEERYQAVVDERAQADQSSQDLAAQLQRLQQEHQDLQGVIERWRAGEKQNRETTGAPTETTTGAAEELGFRFILDEQSWEYLDAPTEAVRQLQQSNDSGDNLERVIPRRRGPRGRL